MMEASVRNDSSRRRRAHLKVDIVVLLLLFCVVVAAAVGPKNDLSTVSDYENMLNNRTATI